MSKIISISIGSKKIKANHVSLRQDVNDHHRFVIECDAHALGDKDGKIDADEVYDYIGHDVSIKVTIKGSSDKGVEFMGIIQQIDLAKVNNEYDQVTLIGKSNTLLVDDGADVRSFEEETIAEIAKKVFSGFSDKVNINVSNDVAIPYCTQYRESAFDFIQRLAFQYGHWFYYDGSKLQLGDYETTNSFDLKLGKNMSHINMTLSMFPVNFGWLHRDYKANTSFEVNATDISAPKMDSYGQAALDASRGVFNTGHKSIVGLPFETEKDLTVFAKARLFSAAAQMMLLYGDSTHPGIHIGTKINLKGRTDENLGAYYVTQITHDCDDHGKYSNSFQAIPAALKSAPPNAHVKIPQAYAQTAIVKDNSDPDNLGRLRVQFPWQSSDEMTPWIRMVVPYAGAGDHYFIPEIDDEVMVDFEFKNPDRPFVLGAVYHGGTPPQYANENNTTKAIQTKGGHRIIFEDGEEAAISIIAKDDKCSLVFSLTGDGEINITTEGVINMKAKTFEMEGDDLNIKMSNAINLEAGGDLNMKGANANVTADQAATLKGMEAKVTGDTAAELAGAQVKVDGSATATIKGGMVMIN